MKSEFLSLKFIIPLSKELSLLKNEIKSENNNYFDRTSIF